MWLWAGALLSTAGAGFAARLMDWSNVFTPDGVELIPADSHYYVRFALRQLAAGAAFQPYDPFVNFPSGAQVLWPGLHTWLVALFITLFGHANAELAAAWVGPCIATLEMLLLALFSARWLGLARGAALGWMLALTPMIIEVGRLGTADHHVHEPMLVAGLAVLWGAALERSSVRLACAAGWLGGLTQFLTTSAFVYALFPPAAIVVAAWLDPDADRRRRYPRLALGGGAACAITVALGALIFGASWTLEFERLSSFSVLFPSTLFCGAAGLAQLRQRKGYALLALAGAGAALVGSQLIRALAQLDRRDPLLQLVDESKPLTLAWAWLLLGPLLVAGVLGWLGATWAVIKERRVQMAPAVLGTLLLSVAAAHQVRFTASLAGAAAVCAVLGAAPFLETSRLARARGVVVAAGAIAFLSSLLAVRPNPAPPDVVCVRPLLRWMREHTPPASPDSMSDSPPAYGVAANVMLGHFITLWGDRPAIGTPFSQAPGHIEANDQVMRLLAATSDEQAYGLARGLRVRYVLATPVHHLLGGGGAQGKLRLWRRLLYDGALEMGPQGGSAHFRWLADSSQTISSTDPTRCARLFEVVDGAILTGQAIPGAVVTAQLPLSQSGVRVVYERAATADNNGRFRLAVAYPTADSRYVVTAGDRRAEVDVTEEQVHTGAVVAVEGWTEDAGTAVEGAAGPPR